jgi:hypothetical protein
MCRLILLSWLLTTQPGGGGPGDFERPRPVEINGYAGHAMEPFLSRDGAVLFFNSRNRPEDQTDLHVAHRIDDFRFEYAGPLDGANSPALDGVPSLDSHGKFYFVSPRDYDVTRNTLWRGVFENGAVEAVEPVPGGLSPNALLRLNMDAEISASGERLYYTFNRWRLFGGGIASSNIHVAFRADDGGFHPAADSEALFAAVNTAKLEFAPATTPDELTLYFTRVDRRALQRGEADGFGIFVATRPDRDAPFGPPERIAAIEGYVEAPTISPDGCLLYFHKLVDDRFVIQAARRSACRP